MNEMKKNILRTSIISLMMFIISAIPVMAQTKKYSYDLVVGGSETKYVATKAGGSSFENKYYVITVNNMTVTGINEVVLP